MSEALGKLVEHLDLFRVSWADVTPAFTRTGPSCQDDVESMTDTSLLTAVEQLAQVRRDADAVMVRLAAEVAARSDRSFGAEGLAKRQGCQNAGRLLATLTGSAVGQASKLITVGVATAERSSFTGERLPAKRPHLAAALTAGALTVEQASLIVGMLHRVTLRANLDDMDAVEAALAEKAAELPFDLLTRAVKYAEARLDQDGTPPADEQRWLARYLTMVEEATGMVRVNGLLDPVTAAAFKTAIEAIVSAILRKKRQQTRHTAPGDAGQDRDGGDRDGTDLTLDDGDATNCDGVTDGGGVADCGDAVGQPLLEDLRSIPQMQADALAMLAQHALECEATDLPLESVTIIARANIDDLTTGDGVATIDGIDQPISIGELRNLAVAAGILPMIMGGPSQPLDVGRKNRFFSKAQKAALAERDGGCASCGLNVNYTHAHHIRWWKKHHGRSDLSNGVMLCSHCHHLIHDDDWDIHVRNGQVWFTPPPHIDPTRTPRLGGNARWQITTAA